MDYSDRLEAIESTLAQRLREVRRARGMTQAELAERMGMGVAGLNRAEKAGRSLRAAEVVLAAEALEVPVDALLPTGVVGGMAAELAKAEAEVRAAADRLSRLTAALARGAEGAEPA